jgi:hypothetical protein
MDKLTYTDWKAQQQAKEGWNPTSFDAYKREFPEVKEYICVVLSPDHKLYHLPQTPLLETDCLAEACGFVYNLFKNEGIECAVFQERIDGYREHYQHKAYHDKRGRNGRFVKA